MNSTQLLAHAKKLYIHLKMDGEKLIVDAPKEQIKADFLKQLTINKPLLIKLLKLKHLIKTVGLYYQATEEKIEEFFIDTLQEHSLETALNTFHNLMAEIFPEKFALTKEI